MKVGYVVLSQQYFPVNIKGFPRYRSTEPSGHGGYSVASACVKVGSKEHFGFTWHRLANGFSFTQNGNGTLAISEAKIGADVENLISVFF